MPLDIVLYALVAVGLVFWLRSLLGTRNEGEPQRPNPFIDTDKLTGPATGKLLPAKPKTGRLPDGQADMTYGLGRNMEVLPAAQPGLSDIARADRGFDLGHFMSGAQDAFTMIVEAFAAGDRNTLKNLLADAVYDSFSQALNLREQAGEQVSVEIHAIRRAELVNAWMAGRLAYITMRFVADETNVVKGQDGQLLAGHPDRITETIDIWTFRRDVKSRAPGWQVCETREEPHEDMQGALPDSAARDQA